MSRQKRGVDICHLTHNASRILRKVGDGVLNTRFLLLFVGYSGNLTLFLNINANLGLLYEYINFHTYHCLLQPKVILQNIVRNIYYYTDSIFGSNIIHVIVQLLGKVFNSEICYATCPDPRKSECSG